MAEDYGQPVVRYSIVRDFMQKEGHQYKVVVFLFDREKNLVAKFRICQCHVDRLLGSMSDNLKKVVKSQKIGGKPEGKDDDVRYIG